MWPLAWRLFICSLNHLHVLSCVFCSHHKRVKWSWCIELWNVGMYMIVICYPNIDYLYFLAVIEGTTALWILWWKKSVSKLKLKLNCPSGCWLIIFWEEQVQKWLYLRKSKNASFKWSISPLSIGVETKLKGHFSPYTQKNNNEREKASSPHPLFQESIDN